MPRFNLDINRSFDVQTPLALRARVTNGRVRIRGVAGSTARIEVHLEVRASSREEAEAEAERYAEGISLEDNVLSVESPGRARLWGRAFGLQFGPGFSRHFDHAFEHRGGIRATYEIAVPVVTRAELEASNGPLSVEGLAGPLDARVMNGALAIADVQARVMANVMNGPSNLARCGTALDLTAVNGPVHVQTVGSLNLDATNGPVSIDSVAGELRGSLHNGLLHYAGGIGGDIDIEASNARLTLELPSGSRFALDAETTGGSVESDFSVAEEAARDEAVPAVRLRVRHGDIRLVKMRRPAAAAV
jgi:hypothetical protein